MRRYIFLFFALTALPLYSQNFKLNAGGSYSFFSNINERQVSFYGYGINYSYYLYKRAGLFVTYDRYLPSTYFGMVQYWDSETATAPAYISGGANSFGLGFKMKIIAPASKKAEVNTFIGSSLFIHKGTYNKEPFIRHYGGWWISDIKNVVNSVYFGTEVIFNLAGIPLFLSGGYNQVFGQKVPYDKWDGFSVPFSSSLTVKAGITFPVMKGPVPVDIKPIEY